MFSASFHVKMNKLASIYVILAFLSIEFEDYYLILQSHSERKQALGRLRITTSKQKRAKQTSKERRALVRRRFYDLFGFVVNL
jgi:hypothetical protein